MRNSTNCYSVSKWTTVEEIFEISETSKALSFIPLSFLEHIISW